MPINSIRPLPSIADSHDFQLAVQNAPKAQAMDGSTLVDLSFVYPRQYSECTWWPLRDTLAGYVP
jgi:hypothetical protein